MIARAVVIWLALLVIASVNGAVREAVIVPRMGDPAGRALSSVMLSALIVLLTWVTVGWMRPRSAGGAWTIGTLWVALTLAFEFLAGHYLFGHPWSRLVEDYDVLRGRMWVLVLIATAVAPWLCARAQGLLHHQQR